MAADIFDIAFSEVLPVGAESPSVMRRYPNTRSPPQRLQSIPSATKDRSPSLRGGHHSRVPGIPSEPLDTLLPETREGAPHCRPYYNTQPLVLSMDTGTFPPWSAVTKQKEQKVFECWTNSAALQDRVMGGILEDGLYEMIYTICSGYLVSATAKRKKDALLLTWLQEEVIEPTVFDEAELSVYEELWDSARMITDKELAPLAALHGDKEAQDETFIHFLRDHHRAPVTLDEGKSIYSHKWSEVLYHLNKIIAKASLYENYAIRRMQEQFILNIASEVMLSEAVKYMEAEVEEIDQQERIDNPPREILF